MGHFFNSSALHTLMCALPQIYTEFHVWCNGMTLPVSQEGKLICFDGKTTITLWTKLNREKKSDYFHKMLTCVIIWIGDHQNKSQLFQKIVLVI